MAYTVEGKKIFATVAKLSTKDLKSIKNYVALGYELVDVKPPKLTQEEKAARAEENKAAKEKAAKENPYSKRNVEAFLKLPENAQPIIGSISPSHITEIAKATEFTLSREDWYLMYRTAGYNLP